jgi:hypothetical protein
VQFGIHHRHAGIDDTCTHSRRTNPGAVRTPGSIVAHRRDQASGRAASVGPARSIQRAIIGPAPAPAPKAHRTTGCLRAPTAPRPALAAACCSALSASRSADSVGFRNRPDPSVCGLGSARLLLFSGPLEPRYRKGDQALVGVDASPSSPDRPPRRARTSACRGGCRRMRNERESRSLDGWPDR